MSDVVIYCPSKCHLNPVRGADGNERVPSRKILLISSADTIGQIKIQCGDHRCVKSGPNRGWYDIKLTGRGDYTVREVSRDEIIQRFELTPVPYVVVR